MLGEIDFQVLCELHGVVGFLEGPTHVLVVGDGLLHSNVHITKGGPNVGHDVGIEGCGEIIENLKGVDVSLEHIRPIPSGLDPIVVTNKNFGGLRVSW